MFFRTAFEQCVYTVVLRHFKLKFALHTLYDRLCGLVVRVFGYRSGGPGSIPGTTRKKSSVSGTGSTQPSEYNWGDTWEKSSGSYLENREYGSRDPSRWPRGTFYPHKLTITSPKSGGSSVGTVHPRTETMEYFTHSIHKVGINFTDKWLSFDRYSSLVD
jgi:hypothetical protein